MAHPVLSAFRDLELDPRDDARARALGAALDEVAREGFDALEPAAAEELRDLLRTLVKSARNRWDDALVVRVLDEWLPREAAIEVRVRLLLDRATVTTAASLDEARVIEAWQAVLAMAKKAGEGTTVARAEEVLEERKLRKNSWSKRVESLRAMAGSTSGVEQARALAAAAEESLRFGKASGKKKSQGLVEANAENELERAFDLAPADEELARLLANVFDARRRYSDRTRVLRRHAAAVTGDASAALARVGYALARERQFAESAAVFRDARVLETGDALALDRLAASALVAEDVDLASEALEALVSRAASAIVETEALAALVHVLGTRRGRFDLLQPFADRLRALAPAHPALAVLDSAPVGAATAPIPSSPAEILLASVAAPPADPATETVAPEPDAALEPRELETLRVRLRRDPTDGDARSRLKGHYRLQGPAAALVELLRYELGSSENAETRRGALAALCDVHRNMARNDAALMGTLSQLVALEPLDRPAARELAELLEKHGRWRDALVVFGKIAESEADPSAKLEATRTLARRWQAQMAQAPQAAEAWEKVLHLAPTDDEAFAALREILTKRHAHAPLAALLEQRATTCAALEPRHALLLEAAKLYAERLGRPEAAIAHLRAVLAESPSHLPALETLERIADARRDYALLAEVVEGRVALTNDENLRVTALQRLAALYAERLQDPVRSLATWRRVLELVPTHARAGRAVRDALVASGDIAELERTYAASGDWDGFVATLLAASEKEVDAKKKYALVARASEVLAERHPSGEAVVRVLERLLALDPAELAPARKLVHMHEGEKRYGRLGALYEALLAGESDEAARAAWRSKLVELHLERVPDAARAWRFALEGFEAVPPSPSSLDALEAVARRLAKWPDFAHAVGKARSRAVGTDVFLRARLATVQARELGAVDDAVASLEALWSDGEDVFRDLEGLLRASGRTDALRAAYERRLAQLPPEDARALLGQWALLEEEVFGDAARAEALLARLVAAAPSDEAALRTLLRFAEARGDERRAESLLASIAEIVGPPERASLRVRRAQILARTAETLEAAWVELRASFEDGASAQEHVGLLEELSADVRLASEVLSVLVEAYASLEAPRELAHALGRSASLETDVTRRQALDLRRAHVLGDALGERGDAEALAKGLVREAPAVAAHWDALRAFAERHDDLSGPYVVAARAALVVDPPTVPAALRARLGAEIAELFEAAGDDVTALELWRRVLDADAASERARERGIALALRAGHEVASVERFFVAAYGETPGAQTLRQWAAALRAQGAHERAAARVRARMALVGFQEDLADELEADLEAAGAYTELVEALQAHAESTSSSERRSALTLRRGELLMDRLAAPERAAELVADALNQWAGHAGIEALAARVADGVEAARLPLWRLLAASARSADRVVDEALWSERIALTTTDRGEEESLLRSLLEREVVRADAARASRLFERALALAPGDVRLREAWLETLRPLGETLRFVRFAEDAYLRERSDGSRAALLHGADVCADVLDDNARACAMFDLLRDDAEAPPSVRVEASGRALRLRRPRGAHEELVASLERHLGLDLGSTARVDALGELATTVEAMGAKASRVYACWCAVVEASPGDLDARGRVVDLAEGLERFDEAVLALSALLEASDDSNTRDALALRRAAIIADRLHHAREALDSLAGFPCSESGERSFAELRARVAEKAGLHSEFVLALRQLVALEATPAARSAIHVRLARALVEVPEGREEAVSIADRALDDDPRNRSAADVLRSLLATPETRARAAASLVARYGDSSEAPELLVAALEARAATTEDDAEAVALLVRAANVTEDRIGDGPAALRLRLEAFGRAPGELVSDTLEESLRLARALGATASVVEAIETRLDDAAHPAFSSVGDAAMQAARTLALEPVRALRWADLRLSSREATAQLLEERLVLARETGDARVVLEALERVDGVRVDVDSRSALEAERLRNLDALGDQGDAAVACLFRLVELRANDANVDDLRARLACTRNSQAALDLEERVRSRDDLAVAARVASLLVSAHVASTWMSDVSLAQSFFEEALDVAPDDSRFGPALAELGQTVAQDPPTRVTIARLQERAARARGDARAVVEALEVQRAHAAGPDPVLDEAIAEALLARGDTNDSLALAWVALLRHDPAHERARSGLDTLASTDARLLAASALATWLRTQSFDDEATAALCEFTALAFVRSERRAEASEFLLRAFLANPAERSQHFALLDDLLAEANDAATRVELHRERAHESLDSSTRFERLLVLADLEEQRDGNTVRARETYEEALEVGEFDLAAVAALERVYAVQEDWRALCDLLQRRLERSENGAERQRLRRRIFEVACDRLGAFDEAVDVVVGWLGDASVSSESRGVACAGVLRLLGDERVRARLVEECRPLLRAADGEARTRVLEVAAELEATRADAAPRWLELAKHVFEVRGPGSLALRALGRSFAGDPRSVELRQVARDFGARLLDWAEIATALEAVLPEFEPWEQRDAVLSLVEILDEEAGDPRRALAVLELATAAADADGALHAKADELSMILADWPANVRALRRRAAATLDEEERVASLRRAATVAREELRDPREALAIFAVLLEESEDEEALDSAVALAREVHDERAVRIFLPRLLDVRGWRGESLDSDALELATLLESAGAPVDDVLAVFERALDGGAPRPRLIVALLDAMRRAGRYEDLARALEAEAERCFEPIHAAPIHDERSVILERELGDDDGAFAAACAACDALPSESRFARVVALAERFPRLLEEALRFVDATSGAGREGALWSLLERALHAFEGDALLEVSRRLGELAWTQGRASVAVDAWLVALRLAPESDPFEVEFEARVPVYGADFLERYARVLGEAEANALDAGVAASASLKRGALFVERLGRPSEGIASLLKADESAVDPGRTLALLVRALESASPTPLLADVLERSVEFVATEERGLRLARAAVVRDALGEDHAVVLGLAARALDESSATGEILRPLLMRHLSAEGDSSQASELLDTIYRVAGDRAGRIELRRGAIGRARDVAEKLERQVSFVDTVLDLDGPLDEALAVVVDAALLDPYADGVFERFDSLLRTKVGAGACSERLVAALRSGGDGASGLTRFAQALLDRGHGIEATPRLELARAASFADPENVQWLSVIEAMLLGRAPDRELVDVLVARARLEADEDARLSCLRRALALATDVLQDAEVGEAVLGAWATIEESSEYFAARVAFAEARGRADEALTWSRRGAEESFDIVAQDRLWREHADRAVRAASWSEALRAFEQLLLQDPADHGIQRRQREALRQAGHFEELARALEDHALTFEDERARVELSLELAGVCEQSLHDVERAREALRRAVESGSRGDEVLVAARALAARTKSEAWLVEMLESGADMACNANDVERAITLLLEASELLVDQLGDPGGAIERLERARAVDLGDARVASRLVHLARELGRWELAIDVLEQQVERDPSRGSFADLVATADASRESWLIDRALDVWRRLGFDGGELEERLYDALLRDERHEEALTFLEERTERMRGSGRSAEAREVVARALEKAHERSIELLEVALRVDPDNDALLLELSARLVDDGRGDDARDHLDHALRVVPPGEAQSVIHVMLGRIARGQWDLDRARSHFAAARVLRPGAALPLRELMAACQEAGDPGEALKHGKALILLPLDETSEVTRSEALAALARLYEDEGDRAKASELYARAVESNPSHDEAQRGLARTR